MDLTLERPLLAAALDQMPAAVLVAEAPSGRIILANQHVAKIWGDAACGGTRGFHHDGRRYADGDWPLARAVREGVTIEREDIRIVRADGSPAVIRVSAAPIHDGAGRQIAAVSTCIDVTNEWQEQDALELLADASGVVVRSLEIDETLQSIARMSIPRFADVTFVYLLNAGGTLTRHEVAAADTAVEQRLRAIWERFPVATPPLSSVIKSGRSELAPQITDDAWSFITDAAHRQAIIDLQIRSAMNVPICGAEGTVFGVMSFVRTTAKPYEAMDVLLAEELGRRAAAAIERSRLFTAERTQRERLEHLQSLSGALAKAITTEEVLDALVAEMGDLVGATVIMVALLDERHTQLRIVRSAGLPPGIEDRFRTIPLEADFVMTRSVRTNQPFWLRTQAEAVAQSPIVRAALGTGESWATVPLAGPGGVIGAVALCFEKPQEFPEPLQNFIISVVRQSAQAIERARLFDSERRAREEAEHASRAKDEFLAILSHELRTPMTTVIGWADLLRLTYSGDDESIRNGLEALRASALTQARLIDDLLDVSRIITGKLRIDKEPVELSAVVARAAETLRINAETKGLTLRVDSDGPIDMSGDPARLQQIVTNLVANAVKFTRRGGSIDVIVRRRGQVADIVVHDTGEGISPDFLPHVFERFRQASMGDSRMHAGLGLGLSIVHHLVQLHGGAVRAESDGIGKGATFTVTLPVK